VRAGGTNEREIMRDKDVALHTKERKKEKREAAWILG